MKLNLSDLTPPELLALHAKLGEELRTRGVVRSANNPTGDLAEYVFCKAFGWTQAGNSRANIDAIDADDIRYQIKRAADYTIECLPADVCYPRSRGFTL